MTLIRAFSLLLALFCAPAMAANEVISVGIDHWQTPDTAYRYSPNYSTSNAFKPTAMWVRGSADYSVGGGVVLRVAGQRHEVDGASVDRAEFDYRLTGSSGVRAGILPYRLAWCRTYDPTNVWIREPDAFCSFPGLAEITRGGTGVQGYHSATAGGWLVDGMVGAYRPKIDDQDKSLAIYVSVGPNVRHDKVGASVNAVHLESGVQVRAAVLRTWLDQDDARVVKTPFQRQMVYDTVFVGIEGEVAPAVTARLTAAAYIGDQLNPANAFNFNARSVTAELQYAPSQDHRFAAGLTHYKNVTRYVGRAAPQTLSVPGLSLGYRWSVDRRSYVAMQAQRGLDESVTTAGVVTARSGSSYGVRYGVNF